MAKSLGKMARVQLGRANNAQTDVCSTEWMASWQHVVQCVCVCVCVLGAECVLQLPTQMWPWQQSMKKSGESWLLT